MNNSINQLGYCLNAITKFVSEVQKKFGENGYLDSMFKKQDVTNLIESIRLSDREALAQGNYWEIEISILLEKAKES